MGACLIRLDGGTGRSPGGRISESYYRGSTLSRQMWNLPLSPAWTRWAAAQNGPRPTKRAYCTCTVIPACVLKLTALPPVPKVITNWSAPSGAFAGICKFTWMTPSTNPGAVPA